MCSLRRVNRIGCAALSQLCSAKTKLLEANGTQREESKGQQMHDSACAMQLENVQRVSILRALIAPPTMLIFVLYFAPAILKNSTGLRLERKRSKRKRESFQNYVKKKKICEFRRVSSGRVRFPRSGYFAMLNTISQEFL